nr:unnamed protein product [Callosobruchus chinensis]
MTTLKRNKNVSRSSKTI